MLRTKRLILVVTVLFVLSALVVTNVSAGRGFAGPTCMIAFDSEHDDTEPQKSAQFYLAYYSIPATGGQATLVLGMHAFDTRRLGPTTPFLPTERVDELSYVRVRIADRDDPARVLFEYSGSVAGLLGRPGVQVAYSGLRTALVKVPLQVPAGLAWWQGRMDVVTVDGRTGHDDTALIAGGLEAWVAAHDGQW